MFYLQKTSTVTFPLFVGTREISQPHINRTDECQLRPELGLVRPNHLQKPWSMHGLDRPNWESRPRGSHLPTDVKFAKLSIITGLERYVRTAATPFDIAWELGPWCRKWRNWNHLLSTVSERREFNTTWAVCNLTCRQDTTDFKSWLLTNHFGAHAIVSGTTNTRTLRKV